VKDKAPLWRQTRDVGSDVPLAERSPGRANKLRLQRGETDGNELKPLNVTNQALAGFRFDVDLSSRYLCLGRAAYSTDDD